MYGILRSGLLKLLIFLESDMRMNNIEMWINAKLAEYQMVKAGRVHPKDVIAGLKGSLKYWQDCYGKDGTENLEWCDYCGWYCECGK